MKLISTPSSAVLPANQLIYKINESGVFFCTSQRLSLYLRHANCVQWIIDFAEY